MEQIFLQTTSRHIKNKKLIVYSQHGYMKGKLCLTNLRTPCNEMTAFLGEGKAVHAVYLSFSKDFITIFYDFLIDKLMKHELDK